MTPTEKAQKEASGQSHRLPHKNKEYVRGFVEALFCEFENSVGIFKSDLHDYGIEVKEVNDRDKGQLRITIPYAIIGDSRNFETSFDLKPTDSIETFRNKVEMIVEEIRSNIKRFYEREEQSND